MKYQNMDQYVRIYKSPSEMKADEYRYWQSRSVEERMNAVSEITTLLYEMKGGLAHVPRLQGPVVRIQRPRR